MYSDECLDSGEVNITVGRVDSQLTTDSKVIKPPLIATHKSNAFARHLNEYHPDKVRLGKPSFKKTTFL